MRQIRYYIDPATGQPHIYNHGVNESEAEDVFTHPAEDRPAREGSRIAIGKTAAGRYLKVIYSPDDDGIGIFVITTYDLAGKQRKAHMRRMRKRGKR